MNEYLSRRDIVPVDRLSRPAAVLSNAQASTRFGAEAQVTPQGGSVVATSGADLAEGSEAQLASAAEYARVHARIADILANLRAGAPKASTADSEAEIVSLLPEPVIIVPLPPASREMVEYAEMLAREMASRAVVARSAQAHIQSGTADQVLAAS
jgi:hypothetical protein